MQKSQKIFRLENVPAASLATIGCICGGEWGLGGPVCTLDLSLRPGGILPELRLVEINISP